MTSTVRWPDGRRQDCWSPSPVVHDHLEVGAGYPVPDPLARTRAALTEPGERVRARYGFACSASEASLAAVEAVATGQPRSGGSVEVLAMEPGAAA